MDDIAVIDVIVPPPAVIEVIMGTKGDPGPPGPPGPSSSVFFYKIDAQGTNQSDPGTAKLRYNAADQVSATALYVDWLTADGFDAHLYFDLVSVGTRIVIQDKDLAVNYQVWDLTGPAINYPDWFEVPVRFVSSSGTATFSNNHNVAVLLVAEGGGAAMPTAPLGQVLSSQGDGVDPVFRPDVLLLSPTANQGWRVSVEAGGNLDIQRANADGTAGWPGLTMDPYTGGLSSIYGGFAALNGTVSAQQVVFVVLTYADALRLPGRGTVGTLMTISDSTTKTPGDVIAGGGSFNVLARWNGTNWIVIGG